MKKKTINKLIIDNLKNYRFLGFLFVFTVFLSAFYIYTDVTKSKILEKTTEEHSDLLDLSENYINLLITNINSDLHTLKDSVEFNDFLSNIENQEYKNTLDNTIINRFTLKEEYKQIRYVDANGYELFRYNNYGSPEIVSEESLQYKGDREYFMESIVLDDNQLYISKLDYNIENGEVVIPYEPIIRFSLPVYVDDEIQGVVIINYDGEVFLDYIKHFAVFYTDSTKVVFIDSNSFWSYDDQVESGFVFSVKSEDNNWIFDSKGNDEVQYRNDYIYLGKTIESPPEISLVYPIGETHYEILFGTSIDEITKLEGNGLLVFPALKYVYSVFISIIVVGIVSLIYSLIKENTNSIIAKFISEFSSDAILITDKNNKVSYLNNEFQNHFGYDLDDLEGLNPTPILDVGFSGGKDTEGGSWTGLKWNRNIEGNSILKIVNVKRIFSLNKRLAYTIRIYKDISFDILLEDISNQVVSEEAEYLIKTINDFIHYKLSNSNVQTYFILVRHSKKSVGVSATGAEIDTSYNSTIFGIVEDHFELPHKIVFDNNTIGFAFKIKETDNSVAILRKLRKFKSILSDKFNGKIDFSIALNDFVPDYTDIEFGSNTIVALQTSMKSNFEIIRYNSDIRDANIRYQRIVEYLNKDFNENGMFLVYQTQRLTSTREVSSAEALIRWTHPTLGKLSPNEFLPIVVEMNKGRELTKFVISKVLENLIEHRKDIGIDFTVHINATIEDLAYDNMVNNILNIIDDCEVPNYMIGIEVVESVFAGNFRIMDTTFKEIQKRGIKLSLDDFGSGYSSLSYLTKYTFDTIKIDKNFIINYPKQDTTILDISVQMSNAINCDNVIEGVETMEQYEYIKKLGCKYYQGYLDSTPKDFKDMLIDYKKGKNNKDHSDD